MPGGSRSCKGPGSAGRGSDPGRCCCTSPAQVEGCMRWEGDTMVQLQVVYTGCCSPGRAWRAGYTKTPYRTGKPRFKNPEVILAVLKEGISIGFILPRLPIGAITLLEHAVLVCLVVNRASHRSADSAPCHRQMDESRMCSHLREVSHGSAAETMADVRYAKSGCAISSPGRRGCVIQEMGS